MAIPTAFIDAKPDGEKKVGEGALNLSGMRAEIDPPQEWKQMFNEVWRQERDYFYDASMNGVDWEKVREKYAALLPYVADRYSLTEILGDMIGELSNSHTYVGGGDFPEEHPVNVGLLGTDFDAGQSQRPVPVQENLSGRKLGLGNTLSAYRTGRECEAGRLSARGERPPAAGPG